MGRVVLNWNLMKGKTVLRLSLQIMTLHQNTEIKSAILDRVTLVGKQGSAVKDLVPRIVCGAPPGNQSWEKAFQALEESAGAST